MCTAGTRNQGSLCRGVGLPKMHSLSTGESFAVGLSGDHGICHVGTHLLVWLARPHTFGYLRMWDGLASQTTHLSLYVKRSVDMHTLETGHLLRGHSAVETPMTDRTDCEMFRL